MKGFDYSRNNRALLKLTLLAAMARAQTDPSSWPECDALFIADCQSGFYYNSLACTCFAIVQCDVACEAGSDLIPTESCTCAPF